MSNRVFDAPVAHDGPIPAYKVVEMEGPFTREISVFDEKERRIVKQPVISDVGYMVFFPRGHSQMYHSLKALTNAGFGEVVPLINMNLEAEVSRDHQPKAVRQPIEKGN
jgi:hypothetical protein